MAVDAAATSVPVGSTSTILFPTWSTMKKPPLNDDVNAFGPGNPGKLAATETSWMKTASRS
jgi:hypothetical protein